MGKQFTHFLPLLLAFTAIGQTDFVVPDGVITIAKHAFAGCANLASVTIPASVVEIGEDAFYRCDNLTNIAVSADNPAFISVEGILYSKNMWTMIRCPGGKSGTVSVPSCVMDIADHTFAGCGKLTKIILPETAFHLGKDVFYHCGSLTNLAVAEGSLLYTSPDGVLYNKALQATLLCCPGGKAGVITVADGTYYLATHAFADCKKVAEVTLPSSLVGIGTNAFYRCESLVNIAVDAENPLFKSDGGILYSKARLSKLLCCPGGKTGKIVVPSGVCYLADRAFAGCGKITDVALPETLFDIGTNTFYRCGSLTNIEVSEENSMFGSRDGALYRLSRQRHLICCPAGKTGSFAIPSDVYSVDERAFAGCDKLTEVTIPSSVFKIGTNAFYRCGSLTDIAVDAETASYTSQDGVLYSKAAFSTLIRYPGGKAGAFTVPSGVWTLAPRAFAYADQLTEVTLPANSFTLCADAFYRCGSLTNIAVAEGNASYRSQDGVLYTRAKQTTLVCCPGGYGKGSLSVTVSGVSVPFAWLDSHGLVSENDSYAAALGDSDGDGFTAWEEYLAGTDPTNPASFFQAGIRMANGLPVIEWNITNSSLATYSIFGAATPTNTFIFPTNSTHRFFRVHAGKK